MADEHLTEGSDWVEQIFQVELDTKWKGGADGTANMQAQVLAARTRYLKALLEGLNEGKQPLAAILTALAALPGAADKVPYFTGDDTLALTTLTAFCRTVLEATSAANFRAAIGAVSAEDISQAVAALVNSSPVTLDTLAELATALGNDPNFATTITTALANKQPLDATLTALAAVVTAADKLIYATGPDTFSTTTLSAFMRSLLDDGDAGTARNTLGVPSNGTGVDYLDVTASRAWNTNYINTSGKLRLVNVSGMGSISSTLYVTVNGKQIIGGYSVGSGSGVGCFAVVWPGATYSASFNTGSPSNLSWKEADI